jgi:hypothetical protein
MTFFIIFTVIQDHDAVFPWRHTDAPCNLIPVQLPLPFGPLGEPNTFFELQINTENDQVDNLPQQLPDKKYENKQSEVRDRPHLTPPPLPTIGFRNSILVTDTNKHWKYQ